MLRVIIAIALLLLSTVLDYYVLLGWLIVGFQTLNGLLLITWSSSFAFLVMGNLWGYGYCAVSNNFEELLLQSASVPGQS